MDNIRAGRLDLIEERQEKDEEARRTSVIRVEKVKEVHHHHYDRWYEPYRIFPPTKPLSPWITPPMWALTTTDCTTINGDNADWLYVNCSMAKDASVGTYALDNGTVVSFT